MVLNVCAVETSVDSVDLKFLATARLEDQDGFLVLYADRSSSCVMRNLDTVEKADASDCGGWMIDVSVNSVSG